MTGSTALQQLAGLPGRGRERCLEVDSDFALFGCWPVPRLLLTFAGTMWHETMVAMPDSARSVPTGPVAGPGEMIMAVSAELLDRAQAGDHDAFRELIAPYQREPKAHCYRMLGSLQDAEDAVQETLLAAWQDLPRFERRSTLRTWLYQIATHRCMDALRLRAAARRPTGRHRA